MIRCLLFGHTPHELFEYQRSGTRRLTYCERCGQSVTHIVGLDRPLPEGHETFQEYSDRQCRSISRRVSDDLLEEILALTAKGTAKNTKAAPKRAAKARKR